MKKTRDFLTTLGLPGGDLHELPTSSKRFPDGAQYRVEIPSTEGPAALEAIIEEAQRYQLTVHRISQGSGVMLLTDEEIKSMARIAHAQNIEVSLFARPNAAWDTGAMAVSSGGKSISPRLRGQDQLVYCLEDVQRAAALGIRSVLLADEGALWVAGEMRQAGLLPQDMQFKISVMMASANPAAIRLMERLGASTYNIPTDLTLAQIAAVRQAIDIPLDIYVEVPDDLGGFVRLYEIAELVRIAAPVYIKFGLRNAPNIYPAGKHIDNVSIALSRERVRRARIGLDLLNRYYPDAIASQPGAAGLALPVLETTEIGSHHSPAPEANR
ncbi:MAG: U32 family peptidase [Ktedonobacteraceae bacterium]|nr:U32 family peptidase [Ktedonobacteraceae bacterium]MBO0794030.1 U32 family peptidase [Ktedonobacteraceae bacterium]